MSIGFVLMLFGPCAYQSNEGFGDAPGPLPNSLRWRRVTYILVPVGAALTVTAGASLVFVDRQNPSRRSQQESKNADNADFFDSA